MKVPIHLFRKEVIVKKEPIDWRLSEENSKKLEFDDVEFAFSQAEKQLIGTLKEADVIITRTSILLTVAFGFVASIIGFVINEVESGRSNYCLIIVSVFSIFYLLALTLNLLKNFKGHIYQAVGSEPILLLDQYYLIKYPAPIRSLVLTVIAVPTVVYVIMPFYEILFDKWLNNGK